MPENGRELGDMLDNTLASQDGRKYPHRLFMELAISGIDYDQVRR